MATRRIIHVAASDLRVGDLIIDPVAGGGLIELIEARPSEDGDTDVYLSGERIAHIDADPGWFEWAEFCHPVEQFKLVLPLSLQDAYDQAGFDTENSDRDR